MSVWTFEYDNDATDDGGFHEWYVVTDGERVCKVYTKEMAEWLCNKLNGKERV